MDEQTYQSNRILCVYADKLRILLNSGIIDEEAYHGILTITSKQLGASIILS